MRKIGALSAKIVHNMCMIDHRLSTLRTFAECGTVAATAELTGYSPSAVSAQLRELQKMLGLPLLVRDGRGLRLTAAGAHLVRSSDGLVEEWERIQAEIRNEGRQLQSNFAMGGFSTAAASLLAPLAARLRQSRPEVRVKVIEADPARCLELLVAERLDLAVIVGMQTKSQESDDARFERIELLDDPLDVMMSTDHRFANREAIALEELSGEEWITEAAGAPYHALFTAAFTAAGFTPQVSHEVVEWETAMALAEAGMGLGLLPRLVSIAGVRNVTRLRLTGPSRPVRKVIAVVRRGAAASVLIRESLEELRAIAADILATRLIEEGDATPID